jgi:hypothetical protein
VADGLLARDLLPQAHRHGLRHIVPRILQGAAADARNDTPDQRSVFLQEVANDVIWVVERRGGTHRVIERSAFPE